MADVVDLRDAVPDLRFAAATRQGLINAGDEASVFLRLSPTDVFWRDRLIGCGHPRGVRMLTASTYALGGERNVMVSHILTRWPADHAALPKEKRIDWLVGEIQANTPRERPVFIQAMALSRACNPADIAEVARRLGADYVPVSLPQYAALWRKAAK